MSAESVFDRRNVVADQANLKEVMERGIAALREDPSRGRGTATTTVTVRSGVTCDVTDGGWTLVGDEGVGDGGAGLGPDPGVFVRAGLGTCLAMGYVQSAALLDVPIDSVHVTIEADYDASGMMGIDDSVPPGWGAVRYRTTIASSAPEEKVRDVVEYADRHSSVLDIIRRAVPVSGLHEIRSGGGG
jgi:putative redox protein